MKILLIGDPHFKASKTSDTEKFVKSVENYIENEEDIDMNIILGDVFDTHEKVHIKPLIQVSDFLGWLGDEFNTFVLVGNHDRPNNSVFLTEEHTLYPFKYGSSVEIVDKVTVVNTLIFVPYVEPGRFMEALATAKIGDEELRSGKYKAIFAHQEFKGAQMGGIVSIAGDEWKKEYPPVYSGHIHQYQEMENGVTYVGTPYQMSYADTTKKGVYMLNIPDDVGKHTLKRVDLGMKSKIIKNIPIEDLLEYEFDEDKITKLVIEGNAKEIREILKNKEYKSKLQGVEYTIRDIPPDLPSLSEPGEKKVSSIGKIIEKLKEKTEDPIEKEILEELF